MIAPEGAGPWPGPWPGPIDPLQLPSRAYRDERSAALARWAGIPEDGVAAFVARMEVSWLRQQAAEEAEAEAALVGARRARSREERSTRPPRLSVPRIYAPRLA